MAVSKMVVLVPDVATRDSVRRLATEHPVLGLHASIYLTHGDLDVCVRDTRRALFDGPLAVLALDDTRALLALSAGADEAFSLEETRLNGAFWQRLTARAKLKAEQRREASQRLASLSELEKLCALGRLVSGVAEELSGPLNSAQVALDALKLELDPLYAGMAELRDVAERMDSLPPADLSAAVTSIAAKPRRSGSTPARAREVLAEVAETCSAISQVTRDLGLQQLGLSADPHERPEYVDLRETFDNILRLFRRAAAKGTHIERDYCDELPEVLVPRARISQVMISLVANALSNLRAAPRAVHRLRIQLRADDALVTITVSDSGRGLAEAVRARVFEQAHSEEQDGSGLELAVARSVLRSLGGDLLVESLHEGGSTFVAWLPRPKQQEMRPSGTVAKPEATRERRHSVLVVEPNRPVLAALSHLLRERYDVLLAQSGHEARTLIMSGTRPDAIVGAGDDPESRKFLEWLLTEHADLTRRVLVTSDLEEPSGDLLGLPWLEKPLEPAALIHAIEGRFVAPLRKTRPAEPLLARVAKRG